MRAHPYRPRRIFKYGYGVPRSRIRNGERFDSLASDAAHRASRSSHPQAAIASIADAQHIVLTQAISRAKRRRDHRLHGDQSRKARANPNGALTVSQPRGDPFDRLVLGTVKQMKFTVKEAIQDVLFRNGDPQFIGRRLKRDLDQSGRSCPQFRADIGNKMFQAIAAPAKQPGGVPEPDSVLAVLQEKAHAVVVIILAIHHHLRPADRVRGPSKYGILRVKPNTPGAIFEDFRPVRDYAHIMDKIRERAVQKSPEAAAGSDPERAGWTLANAANGFAGQAVLLRE